MAFRVNMHCGLNRHILSRPYVDLFSNSRFLGDGNEWLVSGWASMSLYLRLEILLSYNQ